MQDVDEAYLRRTRDSRQDRVDDERRSATATRYQDACRPAKADAMVVAEERIR